MKELNNKMVEYESYPIDLTFVDDFDETMNNKWSPSTFDGTAKCELVFSSDCPENIEDCLNGNGTLNNSVSVDRRADIKVNRNVENIRNKYIYISESLTVNIGDNFDVKAIFLRVKANGYVMAYMINPNRPMRFCERIMFEEDNVLLKLLR